MLRTRLWLSALVLALGTVPAAAQPGGQAAPEISLITFGPGEIYWQRFGHNALLVRETPRAPASLYNYGVFDFQQENFFFNFVRGRMLYRIDAEAFPQALSSYVREGRWVVQQRLALSPGQARELRDYLRWNLRPENVEYRYDYFVTNCSTRVRDAIDGVLDGALRRQLEARPAQTSYRAEALGLARALPAMSLGIDLVLGPASDRPIDVWQEGFVPMRLMEAMREVRIEDGRGGSRPLVAAERQLLPGEIRAATPAPAVPRRWLAAGGLILAGALFALYALRSRRWARWSYAGLASLQALACGAGGVILTLLWLATDHWPTARNLNLLLLDPLSLLLLPAWLRAGASGWHPSRRTAALAALLLALSPWAPQRNLHWALLLAPSHLLLWACAWRRRCLAA